MKGYMRVRESRICIVEFVKLVQLGSGRVACIADTPWSDLVCFWSEEVGFCFGR
jgi:hypothetical protein